MTAIILIEPQMGENIGAAARVMANFGLSDLRIVNPRDGWPNEKAIEMAAGAAYILEGVKVFKTLSEAAADLNFTYATTVRPRELDMKVSTPREMVIKSKTGIVFGPERTGLSNADISFCNEIITINVSEYKSINLAQSVAIIAYELSLQNPVNMQQERDMASKHEMLSLFDHLEAELDQRGFFQEEKKKPGMMLNIRTFLNRASLSGQEARTLRGIIRSLSEHKPK